MTVLWGCAAGSVNWMSALRTQRTRCVTSSLKGVSGSIKFRWEWGRGNWGLNSARWALLIAVNHEIGLYHLIKLYHKDRDLPSPDLWVELWKKAPKQPHFRHNPLPFIFPRAGWHTHESTSFRGTAKNFWYLGIETPSSGTAAAKRNYLPLSLEHQHCEGFSAGEWLCSKFTTVYFAVTFSVRRLYQRNQGGAHGDSWEILSKWRGEINLLS